jgi:hypothetical protein
VRGTFDWGVLDEKRTHPNTNIEWPTWDFGPISVIMCHNSVGAVAYVGKKFVWKVKLLNVPKKDPCKILAISAKFLPHVDIIPECFGTVTAGSTCCRG